MALLVQPGAESPAPSPREIRSRSFVFARPTRVRLLPAGLEVFVEPPAREADEPLWQPRLIPWAAVSEIRIHRSPMQHHWNRHVCEVSTSEEDVGFANEFATTPFTCDDLSRPFAEFVAAICAATARANPQARFVAGRSRLSRTLLLGMPLGILLALAWAMLSPFGGRFPLLHGAILFGFLLGPSLCLWVRARKQPEHTFDPHAIPAKLLPTPRA